jgi:Xaa-Pro aminopeptidase
MILTRKSMETDSGEFYEFETMTLCPIDLKPVDVGMLSEDQRNWLNSYHKKVYEELSPFLGEAEKQWLADKTRSV